MLHTPSFHIPVNQSGTDADVQQHRCIVCVNDIKLILIHINQASFPPL